jgi:hypothetical protein
MNVKVLLVVAVGTESTELVIAYDHLKYAGINGTFLKLY